MNRTIALLIASLLLAAPVGATGVEVGASDLDCTGSVLNIEILGIVYRAACNLFQDLCTEVFTACPI